MVTIGSHCRYGTTELLQQSLFTFLLQVSAMTTVQADWLTKNQGAQDFFYALVNAEEGTCGQLSSARALDFVIQNEYSKGRLPLR
jgi:hypothetical protein